MQGGSAAGGCLTRTCRYRRRCWSFDGCLCHRSRLNGRSRSRCLCCRLSRGFCSSALFLGTHFDSAALFFDATTCFFFCALLGFDDVTSLSFGQCATAGVHFACGKIMQNGTTRAIVVARVVSAAGEVHPAADAGSANWAGGCAAAATVVPGAVAAAQALPGVPAEQEPVLRARLRGRSGCYRCCNGCDGLFVFWAERAALAGFNHNRFGATATHILAHGTLAHP